MKKLAVVCTHPIQYYVPMFQALAKVTALKVFFTRMPAKHKGYDPGFRRHIVWDLPMLSGYDYTFAGSKVTELLAGYDPDRILVYGWPFRYHLQVLRRFKGKIWFRGDSIPSVAPHPFTLIKKLALTWVYSHVNKAFYVGTLNRLYYLTYGMKENQLVFAPHAVDNFRFGKRNAVESSLLRKHFHIPETDIVILFAGKLNANKNPFLLLKAFRRLHLKNVHLLIAGDGELKHPLKKVIHRLSNVHLLPFQNQNQMPALYQCCDLFCLPSQSETWGLAINEAMAAGKAILASDTTGAAADLVDSDNGSLFQNNDLNDLMKKLQDLTKSKERLLTLGQQSLIKIQSWSIECQVLSIATELKKSYV